MNNSRLWLLAFAIIYPLAIALSYFLPAEEGSVLALALAGLRWTGVAAITGYAVQRRSLTTWILVSMILGGELGYDFPEIGAHLNVISKVFLKLIKTIIAPLLFGTLVVGIAGHSNLGQVGRMGWKSLLYFELVTTIALFIGLGAINLTGAGRGIEREEPPAPVQVSGQELSATINPQKHTYQLFYEEQALQPAPAIPKQNWEEIILHIFPENIAKAVFEGQILQIVVFSILFGIGLAMVQQAQHKQHMLHFAESLSEVMFKFTQVVMYFAPLAVGAALAYTVSEKGLIVLVNLGQLLLTLYGALAVFVLAVFLPVALIIRLPIRRFLQAIAEPVSLAFATTSSEAALPKAMKAMEELGVPRKIVAFVMPTGYSFNLDGTTLYLSLATIFVAQAAGIELDLGQQLLIVFTLMLTSKGVAGVPRASLVILSATAFSFGLPEWPIFVILGIDELMDMARTAVNVVGNCLATAVVARWEGEFHPERIDHPEA